MFIQQYIAYCICNIVMSMDNNASNNIDTNKDSFNESEGGVLNLRWVFSTLLVTWPWFLISLLIAYFSANIYLRYQTSVYSVSNEILVEDGRSSSASEAKILSELGYGRNVSDNINNVLRSFRKNDLMQEVVERLKLNIRYFEYGQFKKTEFYNNTPFLLQIDDSLITNLNSTYSYKFKFKEDGTFKYQPKGSDDERTGKLDAPLKLTFGEVVLKKTGYPLHYGAEYELIIQNPNAAAWAWGGRVGLRRPDNGDNSVNITTTDELPARGIDMINTLVEVYKIANVNEKNQNADKIIDFINDRIKNVEEELGEVEQGIEDFKKRYNYSLPEAQSGILLSNTDKFYKELSEHEVKLEIIEELELSVRQATTNYEMVPTTLFVDDASLVNVLSDYNQLVAERKRKLVSYQESSPTILALNKELDASKKYLLNSIAVSKKSINLKIKELRQKYGNVNAMIRKVPEKERLLLEKSRKQSIKQELYIFLLTKREETAVTRAATTPNITVINKASNGGAISPNKGRIRNRALLLGFLVPMIFFVLRRMLNNKIIGREDIEAMSDIPILAEISRNKKTDTQVAVKRKSNTVLSEQFRALRTNVQFLLPNKSDKVLLLTSSMSGEGKSFAAINLAMTFAISGKKVVLLEFDLRKPKVSEHLGLDKNDGISEYAIGRLELENIIKPSGIDDNLFVISSGAIPPNPAEIMTMERIEKMFEQLRLDFDYVVIDTAPAGLVTDAVLLNRYANTCLYIVRQGYTFKQQISLANDLKNTGRISKINFVINDVVKGRGSTYGYGGGRYGGYGYGGYGYGYGGYGKYSSGYYDEEKTFKDKIVDKLKGVFKKK